MIYIAVAILVVIVFVILLFFGLAWSFAQINSSESNINSLESFLGFDLNGKYTVIDFSYNRLHPDRPLSVMISLSGKDFKAVRNFLDNVELSTTERHSNDGKIRYTGCWNRVANTFTKSHSALYVEGGYTFFVASMEIHCDDNTLRYKETGF